MLSSAKSRRDSISHPFDSPQSKIGSGFEEDDLRWVGLLARRDTKAMRLRMAVHNSTSNTNPRNGAALSERGRPASTGSSLPSLDDFTGFSTGSPRHNGTPPSGAPA